MKKLINVAIILGLIVYAGEYLKKNNTDLYEVFDVEKPVAIYLPETPVTVEEETHSHDTSCSHVEEEYSTNPGTNQTVYIRALGDVDNTDLQSAADIVKDFYGYNVKFLPRVEINSYMLTSNGDLNSVNTCSSLYDDDKTIYITDKKLYHPNGDLLRGVASGNNRTVVVRGESSFLRETVIHELGHTFGLGHCDNLSCIMAINNDAYDSGDFCSNCKRKINF